MDAWVYRLRDAYHAGYYRTEPAEDAQTAFPWQNKTCRDCPFWSNGICRVYADYRLGEAHTCAYFDPWNRNAGQTVIRERQWQGFSRWNTYSSPAVGRNKGGCTCIKLLSAITVFWPCEGSPPSPSG